MQSRSWRILAAVALMLAGVSIMLSAFLFTNIRDVSVQGCERQNHLRGELNRALIHFHQQPRFGFINCHKAYSLRLPF